MPSSSDTRQSKRRCTQEEPKTLPTGIATGAAPATRANAAPVRQISSQARSRQTSRNRKRAQQPVTTQQRVQLPPSIPNQGNSGQAASNSPLAALPYTGPVGILTETSRAPGQVPNDATHTLNEPLKQSDMYPGSQIDGATDAATSLGQFESQTFENILSSGGWDFMEPSTNLLPNSQHPFNDPSLGLAQSLQRTNLPPQIYGLPIGPLPNHTTWQDTIQSLQAALDNANQEMRKMRERAEDAEKRLVEHQHQAQPIVIREIPFPGKGSKRKQWKFAPMNWILGCEDGEAGIIEAKKARTILYNWLQSLGRDAVTFGHWSCSIGTETSFKMLSETAKQQMLDKFRDDVKKEPELLPLLYKTLEHEKSLASIYVHDWPLKEIMKRAMKNERESTRRGKRYRKALEPLLDVLDVEEVPIGERIIKVDYNRATRLTKQQLQDIASDEDGHHSDDEDDTLSQTGSTGNGRGARESLEIV